MLFKLDWFNLQIQRDEEKDHTQNALLCLWQENLPNWVWRTSPSDSSGVWNTRVSFHLAKLWQPRTSPCEWWAEWTTVVWQLDTSLLTIWWRQGKKSLILPGGKPRRKPKPGESISQWLSPWHEVCVLTVSRATGNLLTSRSRAGFGPRLRIHTKPAGQILPVVVATQLQWSCLCSCEQKRACERGGRSAQGRDGHNCFHTRICSASGIASRGTLSGAGLRQHENEFKFVRYFKDNNRCQVAAFSCFGALSFKLFLCKD